MGFRFRKSFSLGKGVRLNLGKGGLSTSFRIPGLSLNVSKRGIRPTASIPGTGISYSPTQGRTQASAFENVDDVFEQKPKDNSKNIIGFVLLFVTMVGVICAGISARFYYGGKLGTPTPDLLAVVKSTANAAQTQTASYVPVANTPTITPFVFVETVTMMPAVGLLPTFTLEPTWTPFTVNVPTSKPSSGGGSGSGCSCSGDRYDCNDFSSWDAAQTCWTRCYLQGYGDPNHLDTDGDGLACENLSP